MTVVTGDPASMRSAAVMLRHHAETLGVVASHVESHVAGMGFAGPAADRFRGSISTGSTNLRGVCGRMVALADVLVREAAIVEEQLLLQARQEIY